MSYTGNLQTVATTSEEMFGSAAYVAAGYFGDGLWTNLGLPMRVSLKMEIFNQNLQNEIMQVSGDSIFQASSSGTITLTMRRHNIEQVSALFPVLTKRFASSSSSNGGYGWSVTPGTVTPIGLHIRPNFAYGAADHNNKCWWVTSAIAQDIGEWVTKVENTDSANEDFPLTFRFGRIEVDYTPGSPQAIDEAGRMLYQGDTRSIVANTWETGLPFGFRRGYAGRVETFALKAAATASGATVTWTAPSAEFIDSPITGYQVLHRPAGTTGAFTTITVNSPSTTEQAIASLTTKTRYEVRVAPVTAEGSGQQAQLFFTTA